MHETSTDDVRNQENQFVVRYLWWISINFKKVRQVEDEMTFKRLNRTNRRERKRGRDRHVQTQRPTEKDRARQRQRDSERQTERDRQTEQRDR